jgi:hypothetical protein
MAKKKLGELLVEAGIIDELQLSSALGQQRQWGKRLGATLIEMGFVTEKDMAAVLKKQMGIECVSLEDMAPQPEALNAVKLDIAKKYNIFPVNLSGKILTVATSDPTDLKLADDLGFTLGMRIRTVLAIDSEIVNAISRHYEGKEPPIKNKRVDVKNLPGEAQLTHPVYDTKKEAAPAQLQKDDLSTKRVLEALITLLNEKGIIKKEELIKKLRGG